MRWVVIGLVALAGAAGVQAGCEGRRLGSADGVVWTDDAWARGEAVRVAREYLARAHADWAEELKGQAVVVHDLGEVWEVTYELAVGMVGGAPVVEVEKETMRVRRGYHGQ